MVNKYGGSCAKQSLRKKNKRIKKILVTFVRDSFENTHISENNETIVPQEDLNFERFFNFSLIPNPLQYFSIG